MNQMVLIPSCSQSRGEWSKINIQKQTKIRHMTIPYWCFVKVTVWAQGKSIYLRSLYVSTLRLPRWHNGKESAGDVGSVPGSERSPRVGNGNPLQYSCLGNHMDTGAWQAAVRVVTRVRHELATKPPLSPTVSSCWSSFGFQLFCLSLFVFAVP